MIVVFLSGIFFATFGYFTLKKAKYFVQKVVTKIESRRLANLPRATKPLVICDFESQDELSKWETAKAKLDLSNEQLIAGKYAAKITFESSSGASLVKLEKYLKNNKSLRNWSAYEALSLDIFNPNPQKERIILQIKDKSENRAKINLYVNPHVNNHIEISIDELYGSINPAEVIQFSLLLWDNQAEKVFYLDNISLIPAAAGNRKNIFAAEFQPKPEEKIYATGDYFNFDASKWKKTDAQNNSVFIEIPVFINRLLPDNTVNLPFSGGIPFAKGELNSIDNLELVNSYGQVVPAQFKILSKWPDKSLKWVLVDLLSSANSAKEQQYYLRYSAQLKNQQANTKLTVKENGDEIIVDTGVLQLSLSKHNFYLFDSVSIDANGDAKYDESEVVSSKNDLVLVRNNKNYRSSLDKDYTLTVEEAGPLKVCLRAKGWFVSETGDKFCQFIIRIYAFAGSSYVKVQHTFVYTGYPENKEHYLYKGKRLPKNETISAVYIKTPFQISNDSQFTFAADNKIMQGQTSQSVDFFQGKFNSYQITKSNKLINSGNKLGGWLDLVSTDRGIFVGVKNFWQQFPKEFIIDKENQCLITYLWPQKAGELDLKTTDASAGPDSASRGSAFGLAKTHEIAFYFHKSDFNSAAMKNIASTLCSDRLVMASPEWISATRALGRIWPYDRRLGQPEEFLSRLFDWGNRQIENFGWYGMIDFGDTLSWYRNEDDDNTYDNWGWHPVGRWGWFNCEGVGTHTGALIQFLRSGDFKYFNFGANLARHIMDIDTCHYNTVANDKRLKGVITDDYSQPGSMHRHNGNHWGDRNEETSHTNVLGLVLYYYITGDARALDVINETGEFFLSERITYFGHPDIAAQRSIANVLWGDVILYEVTERKQYKIAADKWANLLCLGQKRNGAWVDNYNPVHNRWGGKDNYLFMRNYTLPALIRYHQVTGNKAIAESIIKATDLMIKSEEYVPCFEAIAYCYWITGGQKYLDQIKDRTDFIVTRQKKSEDSVWDGMIYQKAYYLRSVEFLYHVPFAFEVLVDGTKKQ